MKTIWVQVQETIKKEDVGHKIHPPITRDDGTIFVDDGFFHAYDWCEMDLTLAIKLAKSGKVKLPIPDNFKK